MTKEVLQTCLEFGYLHMKSKGEKMKPLELDKEYEWEEIFNRRNTDFNKYIFSFEQDVCWEDYDPLGLKLNKYQDNNDKEKFISTFNKYYKNTQSDGLTFKVIDVLMMKGPGAGWPCVKYSTKKLMTIDEFIKETGEEFIQDYAWELKITKIEECDKDVI